MNAEFVGCASGNFHHGRGGHAIAGIAIHVEAGSEPGTISWFGNPTSHVSAHYSVSKAGEVYQHVYEQDTAYHAGTVVRPTWPLLPEGVSPNSLLVGIEHEGLAGDEWPEAQYQASAELVADICRRQRIPLDRLHVIGHHEIRADKACPGRGDVDRLVALALTIQGAPREAVLQTSAPVQGLEGNPV